MQGNTEREKYYRKYEPQKIKPDTHQKILRYFPETDMRNGHDGLTKIAQKQGIRVDQLGLGEFVLFVNRNLNHAKLFTPGNVIAHLRMPNRHKIDPRTISLIPKFFNGTKINYTGALKEVLYKEFNYSDE
jgi:hypothetical protein